MSQISAAYDPAHHNIGHVSFIRLFLRALGVSFFSVLSLAMAFYAFIALPQVQDLLFDARPYAIQDVIYWTGFYLVGIFLWALPLVFTARLLLLQNFDVIGVDSEDRFEFFIFRLPSFYVVLAFISVFFGIIIAATNLPSPSTDGGNPAEWPIRNYLENHLITLFIATLCVLVLVIIRNLFIRGYGRQMEKLEKSDPKKFKSTLIRIENLSRKHALNLENLDIHLTALKPTFLSKETWIEAQRIKVFMWRYLSRVMWLLLALVAIHFLSYFDSIHRLFVVPYISAFPRFSDILSATSDILWVKRAVFLFVIFGAWLPFLALLSLLSNRYQFPFIVLLVIVGTLLTLIVSDGHDVRVLRIASNEEAKLRPIAFADAVQNWKSASGWYASGCEDRALSAPELSACPRPIIVAGEGGGSRAAFLLASVLGNLEDDSLAQVRNNHTAKPFHQQLFAISSVSGSSVGAAFFLGALQAQGPTKLEELKKAIYQQRLWYMNVAYAGTDKEKFLTDFITYKDALQAALSNDFLSPVMIAYLARDVLTLGRLPYVMDRAGVLETSWEDAFDDVYGTRRDKSALAAPFQSISPAPGAWMPLPFFNTTSVETGRRVIATPVKITEPLSNGKPLFIDAYDVHEIFCSEKPSKELRTLDWIAQILPSIFSPVAKANQHCIGKKPKSIDIRLSTAASLSARSPFVTPHANIRDSGAQIADSLVDGGYFDNSGAVTAVEIATGLKTVDPRLQPFIIQVSSEPDWFKDTKSCGSRGAFADRPRLPDEPDFKLLGTLGNILTVNATRVSRSYETILELPRQISEVNGGTVSEAQIYICPQRKEDFFWSQFLKATTTDQTEEAQKKELGIKQKTQEQSREGWKSVSLSWWLSPPLQAYLDGQVYAEHNKPAHDCVLSLLRERSADERARCG